MYPAQEEADLKAGRIAAFTKQGQRLIEAAHDKDPFARVRATENLKNWVEEAQKTQQEAGRGVNKALQSQINTNGSTTEQAKEVLKLSTGGKQEVDETTVDNRQRLNDLYQKQVNVNGGVLSITGNNTYSGGTTVSGGTLAFSGNSPSTVTLTATNGASTVTNGTATVQNPADFNENWITRNNFNGGLVVAQTAAPTAGPVYGGGTLTLQAAGAISAGSTSFSGNSSLNASPPGAAGLTVGALSGGNTYFGANTIVNGPTAQNANPNFTNNMANGRIILNSEQQFGGQGNYSNTNPSFNFSLGNGNSTLQAGTAQTAAQPQASTVQQSIAPNSGYAAPALQMQMPAPPQTLSQSPYGQQSFNRRAGGQDDQQRELAEYQQKLSTANKDERLQEQAGEKQADMPRSGMGGGGFGGRLPALGATSHGLVAGTPYGTVTDATQEVHEDIVSMQWGAAPAAPTGLASLDFALPTDRNLYELYRFTTPRGDAELTARTVSNSMLTRLESLAGIAAASLLVWAGFWLIGRGALNCFRRPAGAAVLAIGGFMALCGGLLPLVGLIAMLAGIGLLVVHFWRRRAGSRVNQA